ncbi:MAG: hypothetical protein J2P46_08115 [Zavarzinella sp.]|nr:hypothetical protein [Zavarzinella sp.]
MIFAELHGKLGQDCSRAHERAEDVLTSTAFGLLRYIPRADGHLPLLARVRRVRLDSSHQAVAALAPGWPALADLLQVQTDFWPYAPGYGEPDVLLTLSDADGIPRLAVLLEAKLHAGKSGHADVDEELTGVDAPDPDQLVRYWRLLRQLDSVRRGAVPLLVYLTRHSTAPVEELTDSLRREPGMNLGWLSWRDVWDVAVRAAPDNLPAADLARLLAHKGLKTFDGFNTAPCELPPSGRFWNGPSWFAPVAPWTGPTGTHFWKGGGNG